jgi:hypothetical protein
MTVPLDPIGAELERRNRRVLAERLHWQPGALEHCERIEAESPGWSVWWTDHPGREWSQAGYYALRRRWHRRDGGPRWVFGATPAELVEAIADASPLSRWDY